MSLLLILGIVITTPQFKQTSYIAYPTLQDALLVMHITLRFRPQSLDDAILLYNAQDTFGNGDFIGLLIKDEAVEFRFSSGSGN